MNKKKTIELFNNALRKRDQYLEDVIKELRGRISILEFTGTFDCNKIEFTNDPGVLYQAIHITYAYKGKILSVRNVYKYVCGVNRFEHITKKVVENDSSSAIFVIDGTWYKLDKATTTIMSIPTPAKYADKNTSISIDLAAVNATESVDNLTKAMENLNKTMDMTKAKKNIKKKGDK